MKGRVNVTEGVGVSLKGRAAIKYVGKGESGVAVRVKVT